jgi:hypothetical protein
MFNLKSKVFAGLAALICATAALAQDSGPLIDLLVKKGIINDQEGEDLRAELAKDFAATPAGKLNVSGPMNELRISGDVRIRYEGREGKVAGDTLSRDRMRYRLRAGLAGKMANNWNWGIRLETATGSRSSNITMGDDAAGPFAKNSDGIYVGQIFAQYTPIPELTFTAGRVANPILTSPMVWDGDINPEGLVEQYRRRVGQVEFGVTLAQYLYNAANTQNLIGVVDNVEDLGLFAYQGIFRYYTGEGVTSYFQAAPVFYQYINESGMRNPVPFRGNFSPTNGFGINNLFVLEIPIEYNWLIGGVPVRAYGDFAINLDADARATKFGRPDLSGEDTAYLVGFQYGRAVNKGEWDARLSYQSVGAFALDPNLVDSDVFDSRVNMQGWAFSANYALGAATQVTLTYAQGERVEESIIAPGAGDIGANNRLDDYKLVQLDLNVKF